MSSSHTRLIRHLASFKEANGRDTVSVSCTQVRSVSSHVHGANLHIARGVCSRLTRYWCRCQNRRSLHAPWERDARGRCWRRDGLQGGHQVGQLLSRHLLIPAGCIKQVRTCQSSKCWQPHASVTIRLHVPCSSSHCSQKHGASQ